MSEPILIGLTLIIMFGVLVISVIPFVPGPLLMWLVALVFGFLNEFQRLTIPATLIITLLMLAGITSSFWMPVVGMRAQGGSCWGSIGTLVGGIIGTFVIPLPICGTLIGAVIGALLFEFIHAREATTAFIAGKSAAQLFVISLIVEIGTTALMLVVFVASLLLTA